MRELETLLEICQNPAAQLREAVSAGKKVVGVMPYLCPEELVYAAGMLPFGLWGAEREVSESKRYFPAFICSILHTTLEMGIRGELNDLSAIMISIACDSLKGMPANWQYAVPNVPVIQVAYAQNRKLPAGTEFTLSQLRKIRAQLEAIAGGTIDDAALADAVAVYNENRRAVMDFSAAAALHPELIDPPTRSAAIKAGYFMDRARHTVLLRAVIAWLSEQPAAVWKGIRVVTTGILADSPAMLALMKECRIAVAADQVCHESVGCRYPAEVTDDPLLGLARRYGEIEGCSVLYDPKKLRGEQLVRLAQETKADGVIWFMTRFCDPEEFDYVPVGKMLKAAGIPLLTIDTDQQMTSYEKARSALEGFSEALG